MDWMHTVSCGGVFSGRLPADEPRSTTPRHSRPPERGYITPDVRHRNREPDRHVGSRDARLNATCFLAQGHPAPGTSTSTFSRYPEEIPFPSLSRSLSAERR